MKLTEYLLFGVIGWALLGILGAATSIRRGRQEQARQQLAWLALVIFGYLIALLSVSALQPQKSLSIGQDQCYGKTCFAAVTVDEFPGLVVGDSMRVVRVTIRVINRGSGATEDSKVHAYLIDQRGRTWQPLPGLSGNLLTGTVAGKSELVSRPMFQIAKDSTSLRLVFTHGKWQFRRLVIGDPDSLGHRPTVVNLGR